MGEREQRESDAYGHVRFWRWSIALVGAAFWAIVFYAWSAS